MKHLHVVGRGAPLILVPGIQGRWEYMRPAIDALSASFRVITFPLSGERASGRTFDPARRFDNYVGQLDAILDECDVERAPICGISFGGLVALHYAAQRPTRSTALILASTPGPEFKLRERHEFYLRAPRLFAPLVLAELPRRLSKEIALALPNPWTRLRFSLRQMATFLRAPISAPQMATRSALLGASELVDDCHKVSAPTLVVTGEPSLDYVVPVHGTSEYVQLIPGARAVEIPRSGHIGYITRPQAFTQIVREFLSGTETSRRRSDGKANDDAA
jgi:pimeloyl-ACP methyl ester carboxylesterase